MLNILICDDDLSFSGQLKTSLKEALRQAGRSIHTSVFRYPDEITDSLLAQCDIAFLDIDFGDKACTGIDIARKIRESGNHGIIIFVTNFPHYAPEGYEVQAFRYLMKSEVKEKLPVYLAQALKQLDTREDFLSFQSSGEHFSLVLRDIAYIEAQLRMVAVHMIGDPPGTPPRYTFYEKISALEEKLESLGFIRTQKSYLVNMRHIKRYQFTEVELANGAILPSGRQLYAEQKKKYIIWRGL